MSTKSSGFTLVEILIIAPVVILFIGTFIGLLVNLTGESLVMRERNIAIHDTQATLDDIEANIARATSFLTTTGPVASPQGKEDYDPTKPASGAAFTNTGVNGYDALIIQAAATNKSPADATRNLIYTGTGACDSKNPLYTYMIVYFVALDPDTSDTADKALYKRTIVPPMSACDSPWQRNSCNPARRSDYPSVCKTSDEKLLTGVSGLNVTYYIGSSSTPEPDSNANAATDVSVSLSVAKLAAGNSVNYSSSARTNSVNVQASDTSGGGAGGSTTPPANPPIEYSRNGSGPNPYRTTFTWGRVGNASSYIFKYNFNGGAWIQETVAQPNDVNTKPTFDVEGTARKQAINVDVDVVSNVGTYDYGTIAATATPPWNSCTYKNGWVDYASTYSGAGFTKTTSGIVSLRGLVKSGTVGTSTPICTLPEGFRPSQRHIYQVGGYDGGVSGAARVDIDTSGNVIVVTGENPWVSLSGIMFVESQQNYTWTNGTWLNGWTNYGSPYANLRSTIDSAGRVQVEGLGRAGTLTAGTLMTTSLSGASTKPSHFMHITSQSSVPSAVSFDTNGNINARGVGTGYNSFAFSYYPSTFTGWKTLPLVSPWVNYGGAYSPAQCYKAADDIVTVRGLIKGGANGNFTTNINSIGCGIAADGRQIFPGWMNANNTARIDLLPTGELNFQISNSGWTSIDNVRFVAD